MELLPVTVQRNIEHRHCRNVFLSNHNRVAEACKVKTLGRVELMHKSYHMWYDFAFRLGGW
jgi:hypothetical protein